VATISTTFGSVEFDSFFAGTEISALTTSGKLAAGQGVLRKGAVLGKVTTTGEYKLVNKAATDGSQVASMVLATKEADTTFAVDVVLFSQGIFNYSALYVATGDKVEDHEEELRLGNIYFKKSY